MPARRGTAPPRSSGVGASPQRRIDTLVSERERILAELSDMQARGEDSKVINDAQQLVTRWWGKASWDGREKLLKSAQWLLSLKHRSDEPKLTRFEQSHRRT
jgi:hypothetical protein